MNILAEVLALERQDPQTTDGPCCSTYPKPVVKPENHGLPSTQTSWLTYRRYPLQLHAESYPRRFCLRGVLADVSSDRSAQRPERGHRTTVRLQFLGLLLRDGGLFDDGLSHTFSSFPIPPTTGNDLHLLFGHTAGTCSYRVSSPGGEMAAEGYRCF